MSIMTELRRVGAAYTKHRRARVTEHVLYSLPAALQKDIGWPTSQTSRETRALLAIAGMR